MFLCVILLLQITSVFLKWHFRSMSSLHLMSFVKKNYHYSASISSRNSFLGYCVYCLTAFMMFMIMSHHNVGIVIINLIQPKIEHLINKTIHHYNQKSLLKESNSYQTLKTHKILQYHHTCTSINVQTFLSSTQTTQYHTYL